jgi:hypothetical protein
MKRLILVATLACATFAHAQSSPAKKELITKLLALQQPGIEGMAKNMAERPVLTLMQQAGNTLQTIAPEKREAAAKSIEGDLKQYVDEAVPLLRDKAIKLAPLTVGPLMEEKLSEEELKQLIGWLESPTRKKYEAMWPDLQNAMIQKLVADAAPALDPKLSALQQKIGNTLRAAGANIPSAGAKPAARAPAKSASK